MRLAIYKHQMLLFWDLERTPRFRAEGAGGFNQDVRAGGGGDAAATQAFDSLWKR